VFRIENEIIASQDNDLAAWASLTRIHDLCSWHGVADPVGAEYCVTSCDLGVFVDEAAEPILPENARIRDGCGWVRTPGGRVLVQRPVRPVAVVVIDVLAEDQPQVPFTGDQHLVQALAASASDPAFGYSVRRGARMGS
jgi:hypothetical protein